MGAYLAPGRGRASSFIPRPHLPSHIRYRIDEKKVNKWYPKYDPTDGRSPVPGVGLMEYMLRRNEYLAQVCVSACV